MRKLNIKLGEFKIDQRQFAKYLQKSWKHKYYQQQMKSSLNNMHKHSEDLVKTFCKLFYVLICVSRYR